MGYNLLCLPNLCIILILFIYNGVILYSRQRKNERFVLSVYVIIVKGTGNVQLFSVLRLSGVSLRGDDGREIFLGQS